MLNIDDGLNNIESKKSRVCLETESEHHRDKEKAVKNRLARAIGHMDKVKRMYESGEDCTDVLIQLSAVIAALNNTGKIIIKDHLQHCIVGAIKSGDTTSLERINTAIDRFIK